MSPSPTAMRCTLVTTGCWRTRRRCSVIWWSAGAILVNAAFDVLLYDLTSTYFESDLPLDEVQYLVGTPKGRLNRLEQDLVTKPWRSARPGVKVKLLPQEGELYGFAESQDRIAKERSMRCRQLKWLWTRLAQLSAMGLARDALLMKLGAAQTKAPAAWRLIDLRVGAHDGAFTYQLNRDKLRKTRRRDGRYSLAHQSDRDRLWGVYCIAVMGCSRLACEIAPGVDFRNTT